MASQGDNGPAEDALAAAVRQLKKFGKNAAVSFTATAVLDASAGTLEVVEQAYTAKVSAVDRAGIWLVLNDQPDLQQLWPDANYLYSNIRIWPPPSRSRPLVIEEEPDEPPRRVRRTEAQAKESATQDHEGTQSPAKRPRRRGPQPQPPAEPNSESSQDDSELDAIAEIVARLRGAKHRRKHRRSTQTKSDSSDLDDEDLHDIATGDKGVWRRLVPGIKIPVSVSESFAWMYLYASDESKDRPTELDGAKWMQHALAFRLEMGCAFRNYSLAKEADHLVDILGEIMDSRISRKTKRKWEAAFSLVVRYIHLVLLGSAMAGAHSAEKFTTDFAAALRAKEGKLDFAALVEDAIMDSKTTKQEVKPAGPTVAVADVMARVDKAVAEIVQSNRKK